MIEGVLQSTGLSWASIGSVATYTGPGNFTGIRVGVASARGIGFGLGIPALGVSRFEALARNCDGSVLATVSDHKGRLLAQVIRNGRPHGRAFAFAPDVPSVEIAAGSCIGDRSSYVSEITGLPERAVPPCDPLAALAETAAMRGGSDQPAPQPLYVRPPDAVARAQAV
mgnify:CR=1 FL=1